jgi:5,10-methenyltetrahydrofolate synthetase
MDPAVRGWRVTQRAALKAARRDMGAQARHDAAEAIAAKLDHLVLPRVRATLGLYWPIHGEVNLLAWAERIAAAGRVRLCLPVIVQRNAPLEYRAWVPGQPMRPGVWQIPEPVDSETVLPDLVFAPLVGFDHARYRLGNGGGYFDRTLAALTPRPISIGIGYAASALETIFAQEHDLAMDAIITETTDILPEAWTQGPAS